MKTSFLNLIFVLFLSQCVLAENIQKEEAKDYQDQIHHVKQVDYEFEERLNSFYESEPIDNQDLYNLYNGEFPEGERNPKNLRIHWKDARELALAELELQKPLQTSWQNAEISERPILILDKDGGDFYRYYEYRVIKNNKLLGAIRIPAYRRTENFATAEVHYYSHDEKTYTIHPTGWGVHTGSNILYDEKDSFRNKLKDDIKNNLSDSYLLAYNARKIEENISAYQLPAININIIDNQVRYELNEEIDNDATVKELKNRKGSDKLGDFVAKAKHNYLTIDQKENKQNLTIGLDKFYKKLMVYPTAKKQISSAREMLSEVYSTYYLSLYGIIYQSSLLENSIVSYKPKDMLSKSLKEWYWKVLESRLSHRNASELISQKWNITEFVETYHIEPLLAYQDLNNIEQSTSLSDLTILGTPKIGLYFAKDRVHIPLYTEKGKEYKVNHKNSKAVDRTEVLNYFNTSISDQFDKAATEAISVYSFVKGFEIFMKEVTKPIGGMSAASSAISAGLGVSVALTTAASAGVGAVVGVVLGIFTGADKAVDHFVNETKKEMDNQFSKMESVMFGDSGKGICFQMNEANKMLIDNGLETLSAKDGRDVEYILLYCNAGSKEQRRIIFDKRLYRKMAIRCNDWTLRDWRYILEYREIYSYCS
ncbi:MAG: hypothetical protein ACRCTJ_00025 [Brevinema sp.]